MRHSWRKTQHRPENPRGFRPKPFPALAAFSLIELLIVMALLIVLSTAYYGSRRHQTEQQKLCQANLLKIYIAQQIYASDFHGSFPVATNAKTSEEALDLLVPRYTADTSSFICPGSKDSPIDPGDPILKRKISYAYFMGRRSSDSQEVLMSDKQVDTQPKIAGQAVFSTDGKPPGNNHHKFGGNFLFCDGRMEVVPAHIPISLVFTQNIVLLNPKP